MTTPPSRRSWSATCGARATTWRPWATAAWPSIERLADPPDLVVLDLMLPGIDGLEVCRRLRALAPVPVIMLTARGDESDRVVGLELGADDYVAKPFSPEGAGRPRPGRAAPGHAARSVRRPAPAVYDDGDLRVDVAARQATIAGRGRRPHRPGVRAPGLPDAPPSPGLPPRGAAWHRCGARRYGDTSTITVHVRRLREKIEPDPANPSRIATVWGVGYRWEGVQPAVMS